MGKETSRSLMIIGKGGREHAMGWRVRKDAPDVDLYFAPGNAGTASIGRNVDIKEDDIEELAAFVKKREVDLTIVGPEIPLALGVVNRFDKDGLRIFGPTQEAARLESSKAYAVEFMKDNHINFPRTVIVESADEAKNAIKKSFKDVPVVVKADGLAAGKGVIVPDDEREALRAVDKLKDELGEAANRILIQRRLYGQEVSIMAISDGERVFPFIPAQDYKRLNTGDTGPNTGGMGAFAPLALREGLLQTISRKILIPTVEGMKRRRIPFKGILYAGLLISEGENYDPYVLEYNVRMGDPETQPLMMLLGSHFVSLMDASVNEQLNEWSVMFKDGGAVCIVAASKGYPEKPLIGDKIEGLQSKGNENAQVFHAGTKLQNGEFVTDGGRVLGVTALGSSVETARINAYTKFGLDGIYFKDMQIRYDIAEGV